MLGGEHDDLLSRIVEEGEFFQNWIEYCCVILSEDIEAACQCMGRNYYMPVADSHTLALAPLGVTYLLRLSANVGLAIKAMTSNRAPGSGDTLEIAERIYRIAQLKLQSIAKRFSLKYRDFAPVHEAAYKAALKGLV
jgi:hypothetical protein